MIMKKRPLRYLLAILMAAAIVHTACEDDDSDAPDELMDEYYALHPELSSDSTSATANGLTIDPSSATVESVGQVVSFRVSGAPSSTYTWSVANAANGTITASTQTDSATYTVVAVAKNTVIVSESRQGYSATAAINTTDPAALQIVQGSAITVDNDGGAVNFTATGGTTPYEWYATIPSIGTIVKTTGVYTPAGTTAADVGTNIISVVDADSNVDTITVTQVD